jgi:hypothetical protein
MLQVLQVLQLLHAHRLVVKTDKVCRVPTKVGWLFKQAHPVEIWDFQETLFANSHGGGHKVSDA